MAHQTHRMHAILKATARNTCAHAPSLEDTHTPTRLFTRDLRSFYLGLSTRLPLDLCHAWSLWRLLPWSLHTEAVMGEGGDEREDAEDLNARGKCELFN